MTSAAASTRSEAALRVSHNLHGRPRLSHNFHGRRQACCDMTVLEQEERNCLFSSMRICRVPWPIGNSVEASPAVRRLEVRARGGKAGGWVDEGEWWYPPAHL